MRGTKVRRALICCKVKGKAQDRLHLNDLHMVESVDELLLHITNMFQRKNQSLKFAKNCKVESSS